MAEDNKLVKVQFFYEDGSSKFANGLELERWNGFLSQVTVMAAARGMNPEWSKVKWTEVPAAIVTDKAQEVTQKKEEHENI